MRSNCLSRKYKENSVISQLLFVTFYAHKG